MTRTREGTEMVDGRSRSEIVLDGERLVEREQHGSGTRRLGVEERGGGLVVVSECGVIQQLRNSRQANDKGVSGGGNTASKFQWTYLLKESRSPMIGGVKRGCQDSGYAAYDRRYDGFVESSVPIDNQTNRNVAYSRNGGGDEFCGVTRNMTGMPIVEPNYLGHSRNMTDLRAEDHRNSRNMTDRQVEDAEYKGRSRNPTGFPVEHAEYHRIARNDNPVEGADCQRHTRSGIDHPVDYGGRFLAREYPQDVNRHSSMRSYEDGNFIRYQSGDNSPILTPRSQSSNQHNSYRGIPSTNMQSPRSYKEGFHHSSGPDGSVPRSSCHGSHRILCSTAGTNVCLAPSMGVASRRAERNQTLDRHLQYIHQDSQVSEKVYKGVLSKDNFDTYDAENVAYYDGCGDVSANDALGHPLPRFKYNGLPADCHLGEDRLHSSDHTLQRVPMMDINVMSSIAHEMEYDGVDMDSLNYHEYRPETSHETLLYEYPSEFVEYGVSHEDKRWDDVMLQEGVQNLDENSQADLYDQPKRQNKRKHEFVGKTNWPKQRISTLDSRGALSYGNRYLFAEPEVELAHQSKRSSHHVHSKASARMSRSEPKLPFGGLSKELQSRLSKPCESGSNDIKTRLKFPRFVPLHGPQAFKFMKKNVKSCIKSSLKFDHSPSVITPRHVKAKINSVKKRLKSAPHVDVCQPDTQVSHPELSLEPQQKLAARSSGTTKETGLLLEVDTEHSILKVKPTEDPSENSKELKRQVDHWFLKCMLYLNANPGRLKKFKEQGNVGTLKCVICSSAKEFTQTKDVATHAFTSLKVGLRAPHLGFHRALCILMGWDPEVATNGRWVCKSLTDMEAQAMKEDIILWPPVFVLHSSFARPFYDNDQVKISVEQLENLLRDMGLSEGKATVCYGKPGNPNIMLVKFSGTLSGLQEAEQLHNVFTEKKHGKTELLGIAACGGSIKEVDQEPEDKVEDILYGYLGTVEDFDKLNHDIRQRYVAKSKKEILAHVDNAI